MLTQNEMTLLRIIRENLIGSAEFDQEDLDKWLILDNEYQEWKNRAFKKDRYSIHYTTQDGYSCFHMDTNSEAVVEVSVVSLTRQGHTVDVTDNHAGKVETYK